MKAEPEEQIRLVSRQFGELAFDRNIILRFPEGLVGFEQFKRYIVVDVKECEPFQWLLSVDDPDLSLPVLNAMFMPARAGAGKYPEYRLLKTELTGWLKDADPDGLFVYLVVTLGPRPEQVAANLRAPLLIDGKGGVGKQIILTAGEYPVSYPLLREERTTAKEGLPCSYSHESWERPSLSAITLK